ncbi:PDZ domain-containing protein/Peptidase_S41 domain-containing protein [Cephalotus follicularis]|uniref:C-terminal processing peptidase n=1 Tax=Cephalotus follicularis TaxID=3775 RepID=A0A1Q3B789_CEPFO|nr:PDZ domain-containing protein/Peptidase_S41 domain-containing protein [Cephalotus follicularis]
MMFQKKKHKIYELTRVFFFSISPLKMEVLCRKFDLSNSSILTKSPIPISLPCFWHRLSCSNPSLSQRWSVYTPRCASSYHAVKRVPESQTNGPDFIRLFGRQFIGFAAAATALVSTCCDSPAFAEPLTVAFPVSQAKEVNTVQRTLVEAWGLIRETFIDPTFNHQDWDLKLQQTMVEMFPLRSADAAYNKLSGMLSTLGDPFTRIISPKEYQSFRIGSDGNLQGVGIFINVEPRTGHLVVLSCVEGSPAARAGIHQGDELIEINGERLDGVGSEGAAQRLRGPVGTSVTVKLQSGKDLGSDSTIRKVKLPREYIKLSPISSAIIPHRTPDGRLTKTGYVKLSAFSQTAATDMENAIYDMESQGVQSYILDLRNNPGGLVKAGLDVAQIWLDGDETLVNTIDRDGNMLPINMVNGHALTHDPLVVLVNEGSASASEILAGALHDNGRAILVGHKTFGKGKIQSVTELHDGSALFVTVAKYLSPALHDIDQVGIAPDVQCTADMLNSPKESLSQDKTSALSSLEADSCIMVAEHELDIQESKGTAS